MRFNVLLAIAGFASTAFAQSYNYARDIDYNAIEEREIYNNKVAQFVRSLDDDEIEGLLRRDWKKRAASTLKFKRGNDQSKTTPGGKTNIVKGAYDTLKHKVTKPKLNPVPHPKYDKDGKLKNDGRKLGLE